MEGNQPVKNISEAKKIFGNDLNFYVKGKQKNINSSTIIRYLSNKKTFKMIREGSVPQNRLMSKILIKK